MADAIWIDGGEALGQLARTLEARDSIGLDTEFLRERTFFPKLCLMQFAAAGEVWCVDTLRVGSLEPLVAALTAADRARSFTLRARISRLSTSTCGG